MNVSGRLVHAFWSLLRGGADGTAPEWPPFPWRPSSLGAGGRRATGSVTQAAPNRFALHAFQAWAPRTFRSTVGSIRPCCAFTRWDLWTMSFWECGPGPAPAWTTCWKKRERAHPGRGCRWDRRRGGAGHLRRARCTKMLNPDMQGPCLTHHEGNTRIESCLQVARGISGTPLATAFIWARRSSMTTAGRTRTASITTPAPVATLRGRFRVLRARRVPGAPSATGYSQGLANALSTYVDTTFLNTTTNLPLTTRPRFPWGPSARPPAGDFLEAYVSAQVLNHVFSFGKQDDWLGPGLGGAMAFSNNAQNFYSFHINRIEPLNIPLLSRLTGPFRYEFLVGGLRGHTYMPNRH
jgi:hypothetical protein